jgi:hypothetical protein
MVFSMIAAMQANPSFQLLYLDQLELQPNLETELRDLIKLQKAGLSLSPSLIVPASTEEAFYRSNNLPEQLQQLFRHVNLNHPDEDDIEELAPQAMALFKRHYLLDEFIDLFYSALSPLANKVSLRRPGQIGKSFIKGRPALIGLKELWASAWTFDALLDRLAKTHGIAIEAQSVLIQASSDGHIYEDKTSCKVLEKDVRVSKDSDGRLLRLSYLKV